MALHIKMILWDIKNNKQKRKKQESTWKVFSFVVLLILAGVTIATLTGDNGILNRAQEART